MQVSCFVRSLKQLVGRCEIQKVGLMGLWPDAAWLFLYLTFQVKDQEPVMPQAVDEQFTSIKLLKQ